MNTIFQFNIKILLQEKKYLQWSVALQFIRTPMLMTSITFMLISIHHTKDHSIGGLMVTAYVLGLTVLTIPCGRLLDRLGLHKGIPILLFISSVSLVMIIITSTFHLHIFWLIVFATLSGGSISGVPGAMRTLLSCTISKDKLPTAIALDSTIIEIVVVIAPLIATITSLWWEHGAIISMIFFNLMAGFLARKLSKNFLVTSNFISKTEGVNENKYWYLNPTFVFWIFVSFSFGTILGSAEVGALPLAQQLNLASLGPLLISVLAICSALSGIAYALVNHKINIPYSLQACFLLLLMVISIYFFAHSSRFLFAILAISFYWPSRSTTYDSSIYCC
ncbi:MFS transporter [Bacillus sp. CGMCC 1.16607]|uniref:MFS transporter n=1 Tax=Bacillus sp. CGMCC 1.16607 TaxID=3351842 RepID=UPI003635A03A